MRELPNKIIRVFVLALLVNACTVPDLKIVEDRAVSALDASTDLRDARAEDPGDDTRNPIDSGVQVGIAGRAGAGASGAGASAQAGAVGAGASGAMQSDPGAGAGGAAGAGSPAVPMDTPKQCAVWQTIQLRDTKIPAGAVEGGLETVAGVNTRQYVCRTRPTGGMYKIPGKWIVGLGCYVTYRVGNNVMQYSVLDGAIEVLTPAPGCSFSWRSASSTTLPPDAVDLGDPLGGPLYACHGYYSGIPSSGTQIGVVIPSTDQPARNQCWFQSFANAMQPQDPTQFEVLARDMP